MAKIAPSLQLSAEEIDTVMARERHLRIATIGPGIEINLTPMTFGWAGSKVYIFGREQKVANLRRDPTATVLVDTGEQWRDLLGIMMRGEAVVLEDKAAEDADPHLAEARQNIGVKHGLSKDGQPAPYSATSSGKSRRWIVFTPGKVVSWDNGKLPKS